MCAVAFLVSLLLHCPTPIPEPFPRQQPVCSYLLCPQGESPRVLTGGPLLVFSPGGLSPSHSSSSPLTVPGAPGRPCSRPLHQHVPVSRRFLLLELSVVHSPILKVFAQMSPFGEANLASLSSLYHSLSPVACFPQGPFDHVPALHVVCLLCSVSASCHCNVSSSRTIFCLFCLPVYPSRALRRFINIC